MTMSVDVAIGKNLNTHVAAMSQFDPNEVRQLLMNEKQIVIHESHYGARAPKGQIQAWKLRPLKTQHQ
jgi:hypothetical protein